MSPLLKHIAERILVGTGIAAAARRRLRRRTLVLAYHNVLPDGATPLGDRSLHLLRCDFARQLDHLVESHDVVPIGALSVEPPSGAPPRVIITFDDAYAGAITCGVDELVARGMPATIFVAPSMLGSVPWWDILAEERGGAVPDDLRRRALDVHGGESEAILAERLSTAAPPRPGLHLAQIGTEVQLSHAASRPGMSIGSHTWSHPNLCAIRGTALDAELAQPAQWLDSRFPKVVSWLSYPYGLFTETVETAARRSGYVGAFRIDGGWIGTSSASAYSLPRLNIPAGLSIDGFRLRLAGL